MSIRASLDNLKKNSPEILLSLAVLAGWFLLTSATARVLRPDIVWRASGGILLLSLSGWRFLGTLFSKGLYKLTNG